MPERRVVVVGASLGGWRTVEALRRHEVSDAITLIGAEPHLPYDRPPLSKDVLAGRCAAEEVSLVSEAGVADLDVDLRLATRAVGLDLHERVVHVEGPDGRTSIAYDDVVIATGARARVPHLLPGIDLDGVASLRTLEDARSLRGHLERRPRIVVVGGGFIGTEVASVAREAGLDVAIVDPAPVLMSRSLGSVIGARMTERARDFGIVLHLATGVERLLGSGSVEGVELSDGTLIPADLVVVGIGARPEDAWLDGAGLQISDGVVCDAHLRAAEGVWAVGDVARWHHPLYQRTVRVEHWTSAGEHADVVAANLAGTPTVCAQVPWAWSDQLGVKLQVAGLVQPEDEVRWLIDEQDKFVAVAGSRGAQHAAVGLSAPGAMIRQRMSLADQPPWAAA